MSESFDFYEARLDGLGVMFLSAVEQTVERISTRPRRVLPSLANCANGSLSVFPTTSSIVFGKIIFISLRWLTIVVGQVIGVTEPIVANHRVGKDAADRASHRGVRAHD
jgi:hypothetical protein